MGSILPKETEKKDNALLGPSSAPGVTTKDSLRGHTRS